MGLVLFGFFGGVGVLAFFAANSVYEFDDTGSVKDLPPVDTIVVLAGGRGRIRAASDLWYRYAQKSMANQPVPIEPPKTKRLKKKKFQEKKQPARSLVGVPVLYVSGMDAHADWETFARQVRPEVLKHLDKKWVVLETVSVSTQENAIWFKRQASKLGWRTIVLVTSGYHMRRARYIFEEVVGKNEIRATYSVLFDPHMAGKWRNSFAGVRLTLNEFFKLIFYRSIEKGFW